MSPGGTLVLPQLRMPVSIRSDGRGVRFIEASTPEDLYLATGFVTAADRLWQMDVLRRTAYGRLAELFGQEAFGSDEHFRRYGFERHSRKLLASVPADVRAACESYAQGVNVWIRESDRLPAEFEALGVAPADWKAADCLAIGKVLSEALGSSWTADLMRASFSALDEERRVALLQNESPLDVVLVGSDEEIMVAFSATRWMALPKSLSRTRLPVPTRAGVERLIDVERHRSAALRRLGVFAQRGRAASNAWIVAGSRTASGHPILANDPHLSSSWPSIWYMVHQCAPGLRVTGSMVPGVPFVMIGHNDKVAWGFTNLGGDEQDLVRERFDAGAPGTYAAPGGPRELRTYPEVFSVRDPRTGRIETRRRDFSWTHNGPIMLDEPGGGYALRWSALDPDATELTALHAMNRAGKPDEFLSGLRMWSGPSLSCIWGTTGGHIAFNVVGRLPRRVQDDGSLPYEGAASAQIWNGYIPFEQLPALANPPEGFIVSANQRIVGRSYRHFITHGWQESYRARRIHDLLDASAGAGVARMLAIQADTYSYGEALYCQAVLPIAQAKAGTHPQWRELAQAIGDWDFIARGDSRPMALVSAMRKAFERRILTPHLGPGGAGRYWWWPNRESFIDLVLREQPPAWLPPGVPGWETLFLLCYRDAVAELRKRLGLDTSAWTWSRYAPPVRFGHLLSGSVPGFAKARVEHPEWTGGGGATVNAGEWVSMRMVVDLGDLDASRQGIALGQSGEPSSPHFRDQHEEWRAAAPGRAVFTPAAVASETSVRMRLLPSAPDLSAAATFESFNQESIMPTDARYRFTRALAKARNTTDLEQGNAILGDLKVGELRKMASAGGDPSDPILSTLLPLTAGMADDDAVSGISLKEVEDRIAAMVSPAAPPMYVAGASKSNAAFPSLAAADKSAGPMPSVLAMTPLDKKMATNIPTLGQVLPSILAAADKTMRVQSPAEGAESSRFMASSSTDQPPMFTAGASKQLFDMPVRDGPEWRTMTAVMLTSLVEPAEMRDMTRGDYDLLVTKVATELIADPEIRDRLKSKVKAAVDNLKGG